MIKRPNGKCVTCKELAIYGTNFTPKHCESHKLEDEQNLVEQECISCHLIMVLDKDNKSSIVTQKPSNQPDSPNKPPSWTSWTHEDSKAPPRMSW